MSIRKQPKILALPQEKDKLINAIIVLPKRAEQLKSATFMQLDKFIEIGNDGTGGMVQMKKKKEKKKSYQEQILGFNMW